MNKNVKIVTIGKTLRHFGGVNLIYDWKRTLECLAEYQFSFIDAPDLQSLNNNEDIKEADIWLVEGTILNADYSDKQIFKNIKAEKNFLVGIFLEPFAVIGAISKPNLKKYVDLNIGFTKDSDIRFLYSPHLHIEIANRTHDPSFSSRIPKVAAFVSADNCSFRTKILRELIAEFPTDSFGRILNNSNPCSITPNSSRLEANWRNGKRDILKRYMFSFCFENQILKEYVSEKVLDGLASGTIPIYWGCDEVYDYIPDKNSIINFKDFDSTKELVKHLQEIIHNQALQSKFFEWKDFERYRQFVNSTIKNQPPWILSAVQAYLQKRKLVK